MGLCDTADGIRPWLQGEERRGVWVDLPPSIMLGLIYDRPLPLSAPLAFIDAGLSLAADLAALPFTAPLSFVHWQRTQQHRHRPLPRAVAPVSPLKAALALAERCVPGEEQERRRALWEGRRGRSSGPHLAGFIWLGEGPADTPERRGPLADLLARAEHAPEGALAAAHLHERAGDTARAISLCEGVLDRDPWCASAWTIRGWARLKNGEPRHAAADLWLGEALAEDPVERSWATLGLGRLYEAAGSPAQALDHYRAVLDAWKPVLATPGAGPIHLDHAPSLRARVAELERAHESR